jgi:uncharacterized protein YndB with AHSA1/START domain
MEKSKFVAEFEIKSSPKVLFPYISTAAGLEQWFAEKVTSLSDSRFIIQWDGEENVVKQTVFRLNKQVKYVFESNTESKEFDEDGSYIEMRLDVSDLTQSTYLRIVDHTQSMDEQELTFVWDGLIESLKEIVGS